MSAKTQCDTNSKRAKREAPFSLRLRFEERFKLLAAANGAPLGAYIKALFFDGDLTKVHR